jgi:H/ACA ribonucleoprotein complex subunit 3
MPRPHEVPYLKGAPRGAHHILKCSKCGSYSLKESCLGGGTRVSPKPPKRSPEDKYAAYRRKYKEGL